MSQTGFVVIKLQKVDFRAFVTRFTDVFQALTTQLTNGAIASSTAQASHTHAATGIFRACCRRFNSSENKSAILFVVFIITDDAS
jgi:hypothetical protein